MSIAPPTDIVLDVARAANPQVYKEAAARLGQSAPVSQVAAVSSVSAFGATETAHTFGNIFDQVGAAAAPGPEMFAPPSPLIQMPFDATAALTQLENQTTFASTAAMMQTPAAEGAAAAPAGATVHKKAYQEFEAMVLSSFVETMLPQNTDATFGTGTAGQIWRSMLAQQIATQMAAAGGIGIAAQLRSSDTTQRAPSATGLL
jgi:flagellar protein FlgJ